MFKFLVVAVLLAVIASQQINASTNPSAQWVKLNCNPVCYGAKDDSYGVFLVVRDLKAYQVKLVHKSGQVSCAGGNYLSYFDCPYPSVVKYFAMYLTDSKDQVIVPAAPIQTGSPHRGWYHLNGNKIGTKQLVLSTGTNPYIFKKGEVYRLWYGEDLYKYAESNNLGQACADVYALV